MMVVGREVSRKIASDRAPATMEASGLAVPPLPSRITIATEPSGMWRSRSWAGFHPAAYHSSSTYADSGGGGTRATSITPRIAPPRLGERASLDVPGDPNRHGKRYDAKQREIERAYTHGLEHAGGPAAAVHATLR